MPFWLGNGGGGQLSGQVDIRDEGAAPAPADSTDAFNTILQSGRTAWVPPGTWNVGRVQYDGNCGVVGAHRDLSIVKFVPSDPAGGYNSVFSNDDNTGAYTDHVRFENLTIDGNRYNIDWSGQTQGDGLAYGILALGVRHLGMRNLRFLRCFTDGINLNDADISTPGGLPCRDVYGSDVWIEDCGRQGVTIESGVGVKLIGFDVRDINRTAPYASLDVEPTWGGSIVDDILIAHWTADNCRPVALPVGTGGTNIRIIDYDHGVAPDVSIWALYAANVQGLYIDGYRVRDHQGGGYFGYLNNCDGATLRDVELGCPTVKSTSFRVLNCQDIDIDGFDTPGADSGLSFESGTTGTARNVNGRDMGGQSGMKVAAPVTVQAPLLKARDAGWSRAFDCLDGSHGAKILHADTDDGSLGGIDRRDHMIPVVDSYVGDSHVHDPTPTSASRSWAAPWFFDVVAWSDAYWAADPLWNRPRGSGNDLSVWRAGVGNTDLASQTAPSYVKKSSTWGNHDALVFDRGDAEWMFADIDGFSQPYTVVLIVRATDISVTQRFTGWTLGSSAGIVGVHGTNAAFQMYAGAPIFYGTSDTDPHLHVCYFDGANSYAELDGTRTTGDAGTQAVTEINLGADNGGVNPGSFEIAGVALKNGELTAQEFSDLEAAVADYYPITIA